MTSPSLYFKHTGSSLQISLTSSPLNTGGRALRSQRRALHCALNRRAPPYYSIDELSLQYRRTSSYIHTDKPFTILQTDGLLPTILLTSSPFNTGGQAPTFTATSPSLYFKQTGSSLLFSLTSSPFNTDGRAHTFTPTSPSLYFKQTGSSLLFY